MTGQNEALPLLGAPGSPYTRKMIAALRYRRIPHRVIWGSHRNPPPGLPEPKVKLLPTFYFPAAGGGVEAATDSTPIIRRLEAEHPGRELLPGDPVIAFFNFLIEDYGDEWLTKAMFHYRWRYPADIANAGPLLIFWNDPTLPDDTAAAAARMISQRQIDRLYVVGSNDTTAATIEESYRRFIGVLDQLIQRRGYIMGARPGSADFAVYGQLTQLGVVDPTPAALAGSVSSRVRAWIDRMEDLSGLEPAEADWLTRAGAREALGPLLAEIGRVFVPFLLANAAAAAARSETVTTEIDGRPWTQPTFPYQAKCLVWIREQFARLSPEDAAAVRAIADGAGCEPLFG